ncbi:MAG: nitroreductase [Gammaproteobacteria bacterium]|nr:nitroreductase [Gammaproteobacteria bacterium]MYD75723.1 nitroreductase [Gammaproteobacteria bacterium]MYJ52560.1 nitroreductase [Gammaproteobacteria bacterium]
MNVSEAIRNRKSVRKFLDREVDPKAVEAILDTARWAASGTNAQPWEVVVVTGERKKSLGDRVESAYRQGIRGRMEYNYYPVDWKEPFKRRRIECGKALYGALKIGREDTERRQSQWAANYRAFDAPVMMLFFMDRYMETGSYLDYGIFLQSIMLAAMDHGLATCPQAALGEYPDIVKRELGYGEDHVLICGLALGYEDTSDPVNNYRTAREEVSVFTRFIE